MKEGHWLIETANPVFEGTCLLTRKSKIKTIGVCHGHFGYTDILKTLGLRQEDVKVKIAGFNHNIWLVTFLHNGENAYPILEQWIENKDETCTLCDYFNGLCSYGCPIRVIMPNACAKELDKYWNHPTKYFAMRERRNRG